MLHALAAIALVIVTVSIVVFTLLFLVFRYEVSIDNFIEWMEKISKIGKK